VTDLDRSSQWSSFQIGDTVHFRAKQKKGRHVGKALDGVIQSKGPRRATVRLSNDPRDCWTVPYSFLTLVQRHEPLQSEQIVDTPTFCELEEGQVPSIIPPDAVPFLAGDRAYIDRDWDQTGKVAGTILRKSKKTFTFQPDFPYRGKTEPIKVFAYELHPLMSVPSAPGIGQGWDDDPFTMERTHDLA